MFSKRFNSLIKILSGEYDYNADSFASASGIIAAVYLEEGYTERTHVYVDEGCFVGNWDYYSSDSGRKNNRVDAIGREWLANYTR